MFILWCLCRVGLGDLLRLTRETVRSVSVACKGIVRLFYVGIGLACLSGLVRGDCVWKLFLCVYQGRVKK